MKSVRTCFAFALLAVLPIMGCSDAGESTDSGGSGTTTLNFEIEATNIENHVFPTDMYLDRVFVGATMAPLLATPTIRAGAGIPEGSRIRGFTAFQEQNAPFLSQYGLSGQIAYTRQSPIRIPFSGDFIVDVNSLTNGSVRVFALGTPTYTTEPPTLLDSTGMPIDSTDIVELPIGEFRVNPVSGAVILRLASPPPLGLTADPFRRMTIAVVVLNGAVRNDKGANISHSTQYDAIRTNTIGSLPAAQQTAVNNYVADTTQGFTAVAARLQSDLGLASFDRSNTAAYFQYTVKDDSGRLALLRSIINGAVQVDRKAFGVANGTIDLNDPMGIQTAPTNGFDTVVGGDFDPTVTTGAAAVNGFFDAVLGQDVPDALSAAVGRVIQGAIRTPNFVSSNVVATNPANMQGTAGLFYSHTFLTSNAITVGTANQPNTFTLNLAAAPLPFDPTTNLLLQFPVVDQNTGTSASPVSPFTPNTVLTNNNELQYLAFIPASPQPANGYPVAYVQHGFSRQKEDVTAIANALNTAGIAVVAIDAYQHGSRQAVEGDNSMKLDEIVGALGLVDPFINPTFLARSRDKLAQSLCDQLSVIRALGSTAVEFDPTDPTLNFDPNNRYYLGQSLGGILGTMVSAVEPNISRAVLNVPGGGILGIIDESAEISPNIDGLLLASANAVLLQGLTTAMAKNTAIRDVYNIFAEHMAAPVDPLVFSDHLLTTSATDSLRGGTPPAVLTQFVLNDSVVPNNSNARLARGFRAGDNAFAEINLSNIFVPDATNPGGTLTLSFPILFSLGFTTQTVTPTAPFVGSGMTQYPSSHGFIFDPTVNINATSRAQGEAAAFLASGAVVGN